MFIQVNKMIRNCPDRLRDDLKDIATISRKFLSRTDIASYHDIEKAKIDMHEAKNYLFLILSRFLTLISHNIDEEKEESLSKLGFKLKFEEDIGMVIKIINDREPKMMEPFKIGIMPILKFVGDMKVVWDFIIYNPIVISNKFKDKDPSRYIKHVFKIISTNSSIISQSGKVSIQPSKNIIPKPLDLMRRGSGDTDELDEIREVSNKYETEENEDDFF